MTLVEACRAASKGLTQVTRQFKALANAVPTSLNRVGASTDHALADAIRRGQMPQTLDSLNRKLPK